MFKFVFVCFYIMCMMVNLNCQLDESYNHLEKWVSSGTPVENYLEKVNWSRKTLALWVAPATGPWSGTVWKEKASRAPAFITLCFLTMDAAWPVASTPPLLKLPHHDGLQPSRLWVKINHLSLLSCLCHRAFYYSNWKSNQDSELASFPLTNTCTSEVNYGP